jgi:pimeloyl-ACP methyl ester carboxylesterase
MSTSLTIAIDVGEAVGLGEPLQTRATVVLPDPGALGDPPVVCFGFPGGGYSRGYFTFDMPGVSNGGEAGWHAARGWVFVACDHLCVGDSDTPTEPERVTFAHIAAANQAVVTDVLARLARGSLGAGFPALLDPVSLALGQSMGGAFTIVQQGRHRAFDAIGVLGFSAIQTRLWAPPGTTAPSPSLAGGGDLSALTIGFHYDDVPKEIVEADIADYPLRRGAMPAWGTAKAPLCAASLLTPGIVAPEATAIDVPVLVGAGERDVVPDPREEPRAYPRSPDVTVYVGARMAHMHNFASTREAFWRRLQLWGDGVAAMRRVG